MLRIFKAQGFEIPIEEAGQAAWIDLFDPTREEEVHIEELLGRDIPSPSERHALEESARNYSDGEAVFFTPTLMGRRDEGSFVSAPVTFMILGGRLVTIRTINPRAFDVGTGRASARISEAASGSAVAAALIQGAIERTADILSEQGEAADRLSDTIFTDDVAFELKDALKSIGCIGAIAAMCHSSLSSLQRSAFFLSGAELAAPLDGEFLDVIRNDIGELERQAEGLQYRASFLQEATRGLITEKQTDVLKALSLAAIAFIPATLVASIFGMNFEFMHWYGEAWGPPAAFALMIFAPATLFIIARWLKWF